MNVEQWLIMAITTIAIGFILLGVYYAKDLIRIFG